MIESVTKKLTNFYQISLVVAMVATLGIILYFWKLGFIDGSRSKDLHKASYILESYESKKPFNEINNLIKSENPKLAISKIKEYQTELEKVNKQVEVKEFIKLKTNLQNLKIAAAKLISYSKTQKVVSVFNAKMNKFYDYVKTQNWKTLSRMSDRVFSQTKGHINKNKLGVLVKNVERDFNSMTKITERSILSRNDKAEILSRISNLKVEILMLKNYKNELNSFKQDFKNVESSINKWFLAVSPEVTFQKLKVEQIGRYYVMGFISILMLLTSMFFISFIYNRWFFSKAQREIEAKIENLVSEGMLENDLSVFSSYSKDFQKYAQNMNTYFEKRMSFGSIFQEALPLSSILLDKNLKVIWANKQFCENWSISEEEINKDYMSWDFLSKLTNLGHDDPVLEALKHNVAGIYQIKIKANDESEVRPFEMFVSPTSYQGENRIMLFFYDLTNLEQTIQEQAKGILNPVKDSIDLLVDNQFKASEELESAFEIARIENIYDQFVTLSQNLTDKENRQNDQIEYLHNRVDTLEDAIADIHLSNSDNLNTSKSSVGSLKVFKENVIGLSGLSRDLDAITSKEQELIFTNINALKISTNKINNLRSIGDELVEAMPRYNNLKGEIRELKSSLYESKSKLAHELSQLTILMKRANDATSIEKLSRTITKVNTTFTQLSQSSDNLDKKVSNLELIMSKAQMILSSSHEKLGSINSNYEVQQVEYSEGQAQAIKKVKDSSTIRLENFEGEIVTSLKNIFQATKANIAYSAEINGIVDKSKIHYEEAASISNGENNVTQAQI
jgi:hypothetical protein